MTGGGGHFVLLPQVICYTELNDHISPIKKIKHIFMLFFFLRHVRWLAGFLLFSFDTFQQIINLFMPSIYSICLFPARVFSLFVIFSQHWNPFYFAITFISIAACTRLTCLCLPLHFVPSLHLSSVIWSPSLRWFLFFLPPLCLQTLIRSFIPLTLSPRDEKPSIKCVSPLWPCVFFLLLFQPPLGVIAVISKRSLWHLFPSPTICI